MELIQGILSTHGGKSADHMVDKKQFESTILLLLDRLENSTLLGDRKASIQAIKSFSRENREFIIEQGTKTILRTLSKDSESLEMIQLILETLLNLLIRSNKFISKDEVKIEYISKEQRVQNGKYPSPLILYEEDIDVFDELSIWITDEFLKNDNIFLQLVIDTLAGEGDNGSSFHLRFYCILILEALVAIRPEMAIECIIKIPTSLNVLISLLDDVNIQIKNETLLLLISLVSNEKTIGFDNTHLKSLIVFEGIFNKLFLITLNEKESLIVKNDCLILISNLIKYSSMNQRIFLEDKYNLDCLVKILLTFLNDNYSWSNSNKELTILTTTITIINYLVEEDTAITSTNQSILFNDSNIGMILLQLSFKPNILINIRISLLDCISRTIKNNKILQEKFGSIDIPLIDPLSSSNTKGNNILPVYKVLLHWCLKLNSVHALELRLVCMELLKSYLYNHKDSQKKFIETQLKEYNDLLDNEINIFYGLLEYDSNLTVNPYKLYFIIDLFIFLINANQENKDLLLANKDCEINFVETICELFITHLNSNNNNIRVVLFYLQFLQYILFQDFKYVNLFLGSKLNFKQILTYLNNKQLQLSELVIIKEFIFLLVGTVYEFSTSESPIDRPSLHKLILKTASIENYKNNIKKLYDNELVKTYFKIVHLENETDFIDKNSGLPKLYFVPEVYESLMINKVQFMNSLAQDPLVDPKEKITFENFNIISENYSNLNSKFINYKTEKIKEIEKLSDELSTKNNEIDRLSNELLDLTNSFTSTSTKSLECEQALKEKADLLETLNKEKQILTESTIKNQESIEIFEKKLILREKELETLTSKLNKTSDSKLLLEEGVNKMNKELRQLIKEKDELSEKLEGSKELKSRSINEHKKQVDELNLKINEQLKVGQDLSSTITDLEGKLSVLKYEKSTLDKKYQDSQSKNKSNESLVPKLQSKLKEVQEAHNSKLSELILTHNLKIKELEKDIEEKDDLIVTISEELDSLNIQIGERDVSIKELESNSISLSDELDAVSLMASAKEDEILKLTNSLQESNTALKSVEEEKKLLSSKCEENEVSLQKKDESLSSLNAEIDILKKELGLKDKKIIELNDNSLYSTHALDLLREDHSKELLKLKETYSTNTETAQSTHDAKLLSMENTISKLNKDLKAIMTEAKEGKSQITEKSIQTEDLKKELASKEAEVADLQENIDETKVAIENIKQEVEIYKKETLEKDSVIKQKSEAEKTIKLDLENIKQETSKKEIRINELTKDLSMNIEKVGLLETEVQSSKKIISQNIIFSKEKESITAKMANELKDVNLRISELNRELAEKTSTISTLSHELTEKKVTVEETSNANEAMVNELKDKDAKIEEAELQLESYKTEMLDIKASLNSRENEVAKLKEDLEKSYDKIEELTQSISLNNNSIASLKKDLEEHKNSNTDNNLHHASKVDELICVIGDRDLKIKELESEISLSEDKISNIESELKDKKSEVVNLTSDLNSKILEIETLSKKLESQESIYAEKFTSNNSKIKEMSSLISEKEVSLQSMHTTNETLKKDLRSHIEQAEKLSLNKKGDIERLSSDIKALNTTIEELNEKIEELKKENNDLKLEKNDAISELDIKVTDLNDSLESVKSEKIDLTKKYEDLVKQNASSSILAQESTILKKKIEKMDGKLSDLEFKIRDKDLIISKLESSVEGDELLKAEIKSLNSSKKHLETENESNSNSIFSLRNTIEELSSKINSKEDELKRLNTTVEKLQNKSLDSIKEINSLKKEVENAEKDTNEETEKLQKDLFESEVQAKELGELLKKIHIQMNEKQQTIANLKQQSEENEDSLNKQIDDLKNVEVEHQHKIDSLNLSVTSFANEVSLLKLQVKEKNTEFEDKIALIASLTAETEEKSVAISDLKEQVGILKNKVVLLETNANNTKEAGLKNDKKEADYNLVIEELNNQMNSSSETNSVLSAQIESLKTDIELSKLNLSKKTEKIESLESSLESVVALAAEKDLLLSEINSQKVELETKEKIIASKEAIIQELNSSNEVEILKENIEKQSKQILLWEQELSEKKQEIDKLSKEIETIVNITSTLETEMAEKDEQIARLQENNDESAGDDDLLLLIDDLESKKKMYKDQLKDLGGEVSEEE